MAGKRRAYAVLVTQKGQGFNDTLCVTAGGPDSGGSWAIFGKSKEAIAFRDALIRDAGADPCMYQIVKVELK